MQPFKISVNKQFVGRAAEQRVLATISKASEERANIVVIYGRRRVGKTELIEQTYHDRNLIKLEGLEGKNELQQMEHVMYQLSQYLQDPFLAKLTLTKWVEVFEFIAERFDLNKWTLYFEELQWLSNYKADFIAELKYVWDNKLRHKKNFILILCGSAPSFMINEVLHSKALYNRALNEMHLRELSIKEVGQLLKKKSSREVLIAYLLLGGIPEYVLQINRASSVLLGICEKSFVSNAYFVNEYERILTSSMSGNVHYKNIIEYLSKQRFATRDQLATHLKITAGGTLSAILNDLTLCGFIEEYRPYHLEKSSILIRYCIKDAYLTFYNKFIKPLKNKIEKGVFNAEPIKALNQSTLQKWLGFAFERFVRRHDYVIAKILGFSGVNYQSGVFFNRKISQSDAGFQIDLIFERADHVITVCEVKYYNGKVDANVIDEMEQKLALLPLKKNQTLQRVLITTEGATLALINRHYFDAIITLDELLDERFW